MRYFIGFATTLGLSLMLYQLFTPKTGGRLSLVLKSVLLNNTLASNILQRRMSSTAVSAAFITCPNEETAKALARQMVEKKMVACVNIIPKITSIYLWEGKVEEDQEVLMMIKTRSSRIDDISKFIRENHPYDVAEVISTNIENGNAPYIDWLIKSVEEN